MLKDLFSFAMDGKLRAVATMDAHHRMLIALGVAVLAGMVVRTHAVWTAALAVYDVFALVVLGLICVTIALTPYDQIRLVAQRQGCRAHRHLHFCGDCRLRSAVCGGIYHTARQTGAASNDSPSVGSRDGGALVVAHARGIRFALCPQFLR